MNTALQEKADHFFKLQGHTLVDTGSTSVEEAAELVFRILKKGGMP